MVKTPSIEDIERYREMILTNPYTYVPNLQQARERVRRGGELECMQLAIAEGSDYPDTKEGKQARKDAVDVIHKRIVDIGGQLDWLDAELEEYADVVAEIEERENQQMTPQQRLLRPNRATKRKTAKTAKKKGKTKAT